MIGSAAGMCEGGIIPVVYAVAPFLAYRAYEFIRNDICFQRKNVKIIAHSMGMDFCTWGPSHHTTEDIGALRSLPNLTIWCPATALEIRQMVRKAVEVDGPVYIRMGREKDREILKEDTIFENGKGIIISEGSDMTLFSTGTITYEAVQAVEKLKDKVSIKMIHLPSIKPLDEALIVSSARETNRVVTIDEHNVIGGIGTAIADILMTNNVCAKFEKIGLEDCFAKGYGKHTEMKDMNGIGVNDITSRIEQFMGLKKI